MRLRSKRLAKGLDPAASAFLDSTPEDARLVLDDVIGSLAHVTVLADAKILTSAEAEALRKALRTFYKMALRDEFHLEAAHEDVHMNVEVQLTQKLGALGKKLHTARSRNDQVALDLRLWARRWTLETGSAVALIVKALIRLAEKAPDAVLPGYTHLQVAQPIHLKFWLQAHAERFLRDLDRLKDAYVRLNVSPLGAAALAGTRHNIDPTIAAKLLGFDRCFGNAMDAVSDRDYVVELLHCAALTTVHASSLSEDLVLYTSQEFGFVTIGDEYATGSSIMPQKKNPDVFEVTRARAGTITGALAAALTILKGLPMAYNRDLQEQKRLFLGSYADVAAHLRLVAHALGSLTFNVPRMRAAAQQGYADATDLADYLVRKGVPFRDAHEYSARLVRVGIQKKLPLARLKLADFQRVAPMVQKDIFGYLGPDASVAGKVSAGSTGPKAVEAGRADLRRRYFALEKWWVDTSRRWEASTQVLVRPAKQVKK